MLVLITYDVNTEDAKGRGRLRKVAKQCVNYGQRVQNSVFEVLVEPAQLVTLKAGLSGVIDKEKDSVRIYRLGSNWRSRIETLGKELSYEQDGVIMF